jgi:hypothetical protein
MTKFNKENRTALETWLKQATCRLSSASAARVRTEIQEHYESARESAISSGTSAVEADRLAIGSLGDAKTANRQYRKVLLTASEARLLREANWERRVVCSRPLLKWLMRALPVMALCFAAAAFASGESDVARLLLAAGLGMGLLLAAPTLPIYTPFRGRVFRYVKWAGLLAMTGLAFGPAFLEWSWLVAACMWPLAWNEWMQISLRRKLPVAEWPKQLYL